MKKSEGLLLVTRAVLLVIAIIAISKSGFFSPEPLDLTTAIQALKSEFQQNTRPTRLMDIQEILNETAAAELRSPAASLPHLEDPSDELTALAKFAKSCKLPRANLHFRNVSLEKAYVWQQYICNPSFNLPKNFFDHAPFMHPSGKSYVWLASRDAKFDSSWRREHRNKMHILERLNDAEVFGMILGISASELENLLEPTVFLVGRKFTFISKPGYEDQKMHSAIAVYNRNAWDKFLSTKPWVVISNLNSPACLVKEKNVCWVANTSARSRLYNLVLQTLIILIAVMLFFGGFFLLRKKRLERKQEEQRVFVAQMLTHELRTPATGLSLGLETFRQDFDQLPVSSQKSFLQLSEEVQRLHRVLEASQDYLSVSETVTQNKKALTALNPFLQSLCENFADVSFFPLPTEPSLILHRRWFELCVKNLIDNALKHGKPPVQVLLAEDKDSYSISVRDEGSMPEKSISEMMTPFHKGNTSSGLGLGLTIVQKVLKQMDANLKVSFSPTTFAIQIRKQK